MQVNNARWVLPTGRLLSAADKLRDVIAPKPGSPPVGTLAAPHPHPHPQPPAASRHVTPQERLERLRGELSQLQRDSWMPWAKYWVSSTGQAVGLGAALVGLFLLCSPPNVAATPVALMGVYFGMRLYHWAQGLAGTHRQSWEAKKIAVAQTAAQVSLLEDLLAGVAPRCSGEERQ